MPHQRFWYHITKHRPIAKVFTTGATLGDTWDPCRVPWRVQERKGWAQTRASRDATECNLSWLKVIICTRIGVISVLCGHELRTVTNTNTCTKCAYWVPPTTVSEEYIAISLWSAIFKTECFFSGRYIHNYFADGPHFTVVFLFSLYTRQELAINKI